MCERATIASIFEWLCAAGGHDIIGREGRCACAGVAGEGDQRKAPRVLLVLYRGCRLGVGSLDVREERQWDVLAL